MASELRPRPFCLPAPRPVLRARLAVLGATGAATIVLLVLGSNPHTAAFTTLATVTGGVGICIRLTEPYQAPWIRITVLVVILVLVVTVLGAGYPPVMSVTVILAMMGCSTEAARRLTDEPSGRTMLST